MYFEIDIARFILCLAVATTLSIFFFIFYPQSFALTLPLLIGFSLRVVGPIALWFGILLFLWQWIPAARGGRVYKPTINDKPGVMYYDDQSVLWVPGSKEELEYRWIKNKGDRMLYGVYIEFKDNIRVYHAKLEHKPYATIDVTFNRDGPFTFSVSDFHKRKD
jgi:hypothetical protein